MPPPEPPAAATAGPPAPAPGARLRAALRPLVRWESALVLALLGTIWLGQHLSSAFMEPTNFFYLSLDIGEIAIMALPLTLIIITGEIDLSVASILGLGGTVLAELYSHGWSIWAAMAVTLVVGAAAGAFNGALVTKIGLPSLAVTIGTLTLYRGIAQILLPNDTIGGFPTSLTKIGVEPIPGTQIPWSILFFGILAVIFAVVLHATRWGRAIFAIGANSEAATFSGIRVKRIKMWLFVISGVLCAFAGILWTFRFASARYDAGIGLELNVVTVVLLGGVSIFGGRGTILGVVLAVAVLATMQDALTLALVSAQDQNIVIGGLLLASVILPNAKELYVRGRTRLQSAAARRAGRARARSDAAGAAPPAEQLEREGA